MRHRFLLQSIAPTAKLGRLEDYVVDRKIKFFTGKIF